MHPYLQWLSATVCPLASRTAWVGILVALVAQSIGAAENDNNVEWNGVYSDRSYRAPEFPAGDDSFAVELRVFRGDITGARVRTWDGEEAHYRMSWVRNAGDEYDIWRATVDTGDAEFLYYRFEITDGSDVDYYNALGMSDGVPPRGDFLVDLTPLGAYPLGATVTPGGVAFRVWAPNAVTAHVVGTFNGWSVGANTLRENQGYWQGVVPRGRPGHEYKYVFDGDIWRTDPRSRQQVSSVGNSIVAESTSYVWNDADWVTPFFEDMIVYELHVGSFSGEGDGVSHHPGRFRDVVDRHLDHLVALGINVVELMPVGEFAGAISWGYNPSFQFAPDSSYGTPDDLKYLVDRCHQNGIAVILDVVYNHMGGTDLEGNLLDFDGEEIYFYPEGNGFRDTPWGPRPDYGRVEVREYIRDSIRYWLEEFHFDGFRLDGTDFVKVNAEGWQLLREIVETVDTVSRKAVVIAEQLPNDPALTVPIAAGGAGCDYQWNDALHDSLRAAIRESRFGDPSMSAVAAGLNHDGIPGTAVVNYIESHDEAAVHGRISVEADGADSGSEFAYGRSKVAAALVLFSAGMPMLLQGQEWLEDRRFGDAREDRIQWDLAESRADFLLFMRDAIHVRRSVPSLRSSGRQNVYHVNDDANVLAFHRWTDRGDDIVVVVSLSDGAFSPYSLGLPQPGTWFEILNGDAAVYGGGNVGNAGEIQANGAPAHGMGQSAGIVLPPRGVLVFSRERLPTRNLPGFLRGDCYGDGTLDIADAMATLWALFTSNGTRDCVAACDADANGDVEVLDGLFLLQFLFRGDQPPPAPWPDCDRVTSGLSCERTCVAE